jgi:hypothetical protein
MRASLKKDWALASAAAPLTVLFFAALTKACDFHENRSGALGLANPAYRLQVYANEGHPQLAATKDWTLEYRFAVPPLPSSPTWNYKVGTVYQWGDVDFDEYGTSGKYKLSDYRFNQVTPQQPGSLARHRIWWVGLWVGNYLAHVDRARLASLQVRWKCTV